MIHDSCVLTSVLSACSHSFMCTCHYVPLTSADGTALQFTNNQTYINFVTVDIILNQLYNGLMTVRGRWHCAHTIHQLPNSIFCWQRSQSVSHLKDRKEYRYLVRCNRRPQTVPVHTLLSADCTTLKLHFIYNNFTEAAVAICSAAKTAVQ